MVLMKLGNSIKTGNPRPFQGLCQIKPKLLQISVEPETPHSHDLNVLKIIGPINRIPNFANLYRLIRMF